MTQGESFRLSGRRVELDGVRGLAIVFVLLCHTRIPGLYAAGATGVTLFFVLSGFLISSVLLEEHRQSGGLAFRPFYARRARRLVPALVVWAGFVTIFGVALGEPAWLFQWDYLVASLAYVGNWVLAGGGWLGAFNGTWSLAVEEQFYIALPLLMALALRRGERAFAMVAGAVLVMSLVIRLYLVARGAPVMEVYYRTDTSAVGLAAGALLAAALRTGPTLTRLTPPAWTAATMLLAVAAACTLVGDRSFGVVPVLASAGGPLLIVAALGRPGRWLVCRPLVWLGQRSYGLYLWHMVPAWLLADRFRADWPLVLTGTLLIALPATELSWRFVEQPILRRGRLLRATPEAASAGSLVSAG
jgi:peptidoglycan/LPS O-acetylase OafA/YrhL